LQDLNEQEEKFDKANLSEKNNSTPSTTPAA